MRHINFDERLDGIMARAVIRLQERMQLAYNRGRLREYLERIDFANDIDPKTIDSGSLIELQDQAVVLLAVKMRRARRAGYLKDFLKQINEREGHPEKGTAGYRQGPGETYTPGQQRGGQRGQRGEE